MTTLIEDLRALLQPLVAGGAWPVVNEQQPPVYPYIVFTRITSPFNVTLSGPSDLQNTRVQIDIFARRITEANAIAEAVDAAMVTWNHQNVPLDSRDSFEDPVRAYRITRDYSVWATN